VHSSVHVWLRKDFTEKGISEEPKINLNLFSSHNHEQTYEPRVANLTAVAHSTTPTYTVRRDSPAR
jgi:hypothetical protein